MEITAKQTFLINANKISINNFKRELEEFLKQTGFEYGYGGLLTGPKYVEIAKSKTLLTGRCKVYINVISEGSNPDYSITIICFDHDEKTIMSSPVKQASVSNTDKETHTNLLTSITASAILSSALYNSELFVPDKNEVRVKEDVIGGKVYSFLCDKDAFIKCPKCGKILSKITQSEYSEDDKTWLESAGMAVVAVVTILGTGGHGANAYWKETKRTRKTYIKYKSYPCGCEWSKLKNTQELNILGNEW